MSKHRLFLSNSSQVNSPNVENDNSNDRIERLESSTNRDQNPTIKDSDSDSDSDSVNNFFVKSLSKKLPYTMDEDEAILKFILKGQNIFKASALSIWKYLEAKKDNPKRTYQSLKNRFLRNIKPNLLTTYRYMIKDERTMRNILKKFPELKQHVRTELKLSYRNPAAAEAAKENAISSKEKNALVHIFEKNVKEEFDEKKWCESPLEPEIPPDSPIDRSNAFKKIELKNNTIFVTVKNDKVPSKNLDFQKGGIYEKYLKLKEKNNVLPCVHCGRGEIESEKDEESEGDIIIRDSQSKTNHLSKSNSKTTEREKSNSYSLRKRKSHEEINLCESPSLLREISEKEETYLTEKEQNRKQNRRERNLNSKEAIDPDRSLTGYSLRRATKDSSVEEGLNFLHKKRVNSCRRLIYSDESLDQSDLEIAEKSIGENPRGKSKNGSFNRSADNPSLSKSSSSFNGESTPEKRKLTAKHIEEIIDNSNATLIRNMAKMVREQVSRKKKN